MQKGVSQGQEKMEEYYDNFSDLGEKILQNLKIRNATIQRIADILPNDYQAVNLGAGDGRRTLQSVAALETKGKKGKFLDVDPFATKKGIIKTTGEEFLAGAKDKEFDFIINEYAHHFDKDLPTFYKNLVRCLKDNGTCIILIGNKNCNFPWTSALQQSFQESVAPAPIPEELFNMTINYHNQSKRKQRQWFRALIKTRSLSNLMFNTQEEIDEALNYVDKQESLADFVMCITQFILRKKKIEKL